MSEKSYLQSFQRGKSLREVLKIRVKVSKGVKRGEKWQSAKLLKTLSKSQKSGQMARIS